MRRNGYYGWESKAEIQLPLSVKLVTGLQPEPFEWVTPVLLRGGGDSLQVALSLSSIRVVNVRKEVDEADNLTFALLVINALLDQLVHLGFDVSFLSELGAEVSDGGGSTLTVVGVGLAVLLLRTIVKDLDGREALNLESLAKLLLDVAINFAQLYLAL